MKTQTDLENLLQSGEPNLYNTDAVSSFLEKITPTSDQHDTTIRKVEYRDIEYTKLKKMNKTINMVYYIGVGVLLVLLYSENNLFLSDRYLFYIFLLLLPYLYPWVFILLKKLWKKMFPDDLTYGPKNAFLNNNDERLPYDI